MHGIILKTIQEFVVQEFGQEGWDAVREEAGIENTMYVPMTTYPDEDVYALVEAAASVTGMTDREVLDAYGEWVVPPLLEMYGTYIDDEWRGLTLIANIERFHDALRQRDYAGMTTPNIRSERLDDGRVRITYDSERKLCDIARGAIRGVGGHFDEPIAFEETSCMLDGDDQCEFIIERVERGDRVGERAAGSLGTLDRASGPGESSEPRDSGKSGESTSFSPSTD